ncbi:unnamed protein product [Gongylonema pulchrum]|uniref:Hydant_A_N domain-containing protein n=1 Tax=Gongylonema pulchrum TaxID=637853 RepID=A0A183D1H0_9BILA|nr:unnamed protein product [Gongylonema pulchrum]
MCAAVATASARGYGFAIDRGGTFTDVYVRRPDGTSRSLKLLSEDETSYRDAPTEAIRRVLEQETGACIPRGTPIPTENIAWIRMGTTLATNALLERKGERTALLITKGFKDLLFIGSQARPQIFDLDIKLPDMLYEEVHEVDERVVLVSETCELTLNQMSRDQTCSDEQVIVEKDVDQEAVEKLLREIIKRGMRSLAVALLHSYKYPNHEMIIGEIAKKIGFVNISLSSVVMPMIKIVPRGFTGTDFSLTSTFVLLRDYSDPEDYIRNFKLGFADSLKNVNVQFMQSDGGLCPVERFCGSRAILSGPAAGVVGLALTAYSTKTKQPVIGFDMGGTSTDVSS